MKSKYPKLSDSKIAAKIAETKKFGTSAEAIRKRLIPLHRRWGSCPSHFEYLKKAEDEHPGYLRYVEELLVKAEKDLRAKLYY